MTNVEFRVGFYILSQSMMAQANRDVAVPMSSNVAMAEARVRDFTRMMSTKFHGSMVEEDPQEFIDEVYKVLMFMGVIPMKG